MVRLLLRVIFIFFAGVLMTFAGDSFAQEIDTLKQVTKENKEITELIDINEVADTLTLNKKEQKRLAKEQKRQLKDINNQADSTNVKKDTSKMRKPLESYLFRDSLQMRKIFAWNLKQFQNDVNIIDIDTLLTNNFEIDYPFMRKGVGAAYLGNLGAASVPLNFFERPDPRNFAFAKSLEAYIKTISNVRFFNVKKPFSHLSYYMAGQSRNAEDHLELTHSQNISPSSGFNIDYTSMGTRGIYQGQSARDKNLSLAIYHTGKKYTVHGGYIYNMAKLRENGGIKRDEDITDTIMERPSGIDINLLDARNYFKSNTFYVVQSYGITLGKVKEEDFSISKKTTAYIGHAFEYSKYHRRYTDTKDKSEDFYENWYIDKTRSADSIAERLVDNKVFIQLQPWNRDGVLGTIDAGIGYSMNHYYCFSPDQYVIRNKGVDKNTTYLYGSANGVFKKYARWEAGGRYNMLGYRNNDLELYGKIAFSAYINKKPITVSFSAVMDKRSPSFWDDNYFSNHFKWNNSFKKESETRLNAKLDIPSINFEASAWQSIINDKIYYGADLLPAQYNDALTITGVYVRKKFRIGGLNLDNRILLQWSSAQEVVPVPLASAYLSYYYEFNLVRNVLRMQIGVNGTYNTKYYAFAYNPSTMSFYNQREKELGNYFYGDFFIASKWKRMRILIKLQHASQELFGSRDFFTVLHYPLNQRVIKVGFSWTFYD